VGHPVPDALLLCHTSTESPAPDTDPEVQPVRHIRDKLTYANVVATLALFVALGGSSYAALTITGKNIKNRSVSGKKLKNNSVGARQVKESRLGTIRRAANAAKLGGLTSDQLLLQCPAGTLPAATACVEVNPRPAASFGGAAGTCGISDVQGATGRRVPTYSELRRALQYQQITLAAGGELTSSVAATPDGTLNVTLITSEGGAVSSVPDDGNFPKPYRCAADPLN